MRPPGSTPGAADGTVTSRRPAGGASTQLAATGGRGDQRGFVAPPAILLVWVGLLLAITVVDVGGYLVAAGRAQSAADAAALAAVAADLSGDDPATAARMVAEANDARLEDCACGSRRARVAVSVEVPGGFVPRLVGARRVRAEAEAETRTVPIPGEP